MMTHGRRVNFVSKFSILSVLVLLLLFSSAASQLKFPFLRRAVSSAPATQQNDNKQDRSTQPAKQRQEQQRREFWGRYPSVEYDQPEPTDALERSRRERRDRHFGSINLVASNPSDSGVSTGRVNEWSVGLPALPISESDFIVVVNIRQMRAHLTHDKSGVISEFEAIIKEILKDKDSRSKTGKLITVDRVGGIVEYPNGHKELYAIVEQNMPVIGAEYLLFLKTIDTGKDYEIITGYQFENGYVKPLDGAGQFRSYRGANQAVLVQAVLDKITAGKTQTP